MPDPKGSGFCLCALRAAPQQANSSAISRLAAEVGAIYLVLSAHAGTEAGNRKETKMAWTTPTLVEICIGLEINGYLPAEF